MGDMFDRFLITKIVNANEYMKDHIFELQRNIPVIYLLRIYYKFTM